MNIAVLLGGISPERNVSLAGGKSAVEALKSKGHNVKAIDPALGAEGLIDIENFEVPAGSVSNEELSSYDTKKIIECINSELFDDVDLAFLVLHGANGEDGKIQSLLELRGVPYTGSNVKASALAIDKHASKIMFYASGIPTPQWEVIRKSDIGDYEYYEEIRDTLGTQFVIKPHNQGSTIGISIVLDGNLDDLHNGILEAAKYSDVILVERFIEGRELTVGIVGDKALPIVEIVPESGFYDYKHKYTKGHTEYLCPADIDENLTEFIQNLAQTAFLALGCRGFGRADFRMNDEGQAFLMELNTIPGFTSTSLVPMAAQELGIDFPDLCEEIINITLPKKTDT